MNSEIKIGDLVKRSDVPPRYAFCLTGKHNRPCYVQTVKNSPKAYLLFPREITSLRNNTATANELSNIEKLMGNGEYILAGELVEIVGIFPGE